MNKWSWRGLNPRPVAETMSFLHAYSHLGFHVKTGKRRPILTLSSKDLGDYRGFPRHISDLPAPPVRYVSEKGQSGDVSSLQLLRR